MILYITLLHTISYYPAGRRRLRLAGLPPAAGGYTCTYIYIYIYTSISLSIYLSLSRSLDVYTYIYIYIYTCKEVNVSRSEVCLQPLAVTQRSIWLPASSQSFFHCLCFIIMIILIIIIIYLLFILFKHLLINYISFIFGRDRSRPSPKRKQRESRHRGSTASGTKSKAKHVREYICCCLLKSNDYRQTYSAFSFFLYLSLSLPLFLCLPLFLPLYLSTSFSLYLYL